MVVFYREDPDVAHLATLVPHNPACTEVSQPEDWWRVEGYLYDLDWDKERDMITCPECLRALHDRSCH